MKTKVYIVTGFLGSGKTTLVKRILEYTEDLSKTIVIVNEFGEVGIDGALIKSTAPADIVELNSGCICCSLKRDMIQTLHILREKYAPERVVIEATGVADPLAVIEALNDGMLSPHFRVEKTITVVDGDFWEAREAFGTVFKSQINQADLILLNKIDTLEKSVIPVMLKEIREESAKKTVIPTLYCNVDPDILWSGSEQEHPSMAQNPFFRTYNPEMDFHAPANGTGTTNAKEAGFVSFSYKMTRALDEKQFMEFIHTVPQTLFRIKGPVRFVDRTEMLNFVGGKSEWIKWPDHPPTCLAFVGWDVSEELIFEKLNDCVVGS